MRIGKRWGYIDRAGKVVIPPRFDYVGAFYSGVATVGIGDTQVSSSESRWGLIDPAGDPLISVKGQ